MSIRIEYNGIIIVNTDDDTKFSINHNSNECIVYSHDFIRLPFIESILNLKYIKINAI